MHCTLELVRIWVPGAVILSNLEKYVSWLGTTRKNEKIPKLIYFIYQYQRLSSAFCEAFVMLNSFK